MSGEADWRRHRPNVGLETNLARKGFVLLGDVSQAVDGEDLVGPVKASVALRTIDLEVIAWLSARRVWGREEVIFCQSHIAADMFGRRPGGKERAMVAASLRRLQETSLTFRGYEARSQLMVTFERVGLVESLERIDGRSSRVVLAGWLVHQLELRYVTFLHWPTLRSLRDLAKRLWIYLEAENPRRRTPEGPRWLALSERGWTALGLSYAKDAQARAAVARAARRIEAVDPRYRLAVRPKGPGYRLEFTVIDPASDSGSLERSELTWQGGQVDPLEAGLHDPAPPPEEPSEEDLEWLDAELRVEGRVPEADPVDRHTEAEEPGKFDRVAELSPEEWPWEQPSPEALIAVWGTTPARYHLADCPSILDLTDDLASLTGVAVAPRPADLAAWLIHNRLATPEACYFCDPPDLRFWLIVPPDP